MSKGIWLSLILLLGMLAVVVAQFGVKPARRLAITGQPKTIEHQDRQREYRIHVPKSIDKDRAVPLVLFLHGGGGSDEQASRMGMTKVADRHNFIVVYPKAINKHWDDGREAEIFKENKGIDDVAYIKALVEKVREDHNIDPMKIFAAGVSNGGFMSQRLAIDCPEIFSAVGVIIATMPEPLSKKFKPRHPVSVLYMNGTADPLVPYEGGEVGGDLFPQLARFRKQPKQGRGKCISTDDAVEFWLDRNKLSDRRAKTEELADNDPDDGSRVEYTLWQDGERGTAVALYKVIGGGHTVPGGSQYLPERLIGKTNADFDGLEAVWDFFQTHARQAHED